MKNRFLIIGSLVILFCSSCKKDFLDRQPLDQYSESSLWTSASDAAAALNGCYSRWESGSWIFYIDCASDNAFNPYPWEGYAMMGNMGQLSANNTGNGKWSFGTIQKCNWFLANVDKTPMEEGLKKRMKAEARFLRAYRYYLMSQLYGDVPLLTENISTEQANVITRNSKQEVVQFVLDELTAAAADLPESYSGADEGRVTSGACWALKARTELFNEKWADAVTSCSQIMDRYSLFNSYGDLFRIQNEHNPEIILDVEYIANDVPLDNLGVLVVESQGGWWSVNPTQDLVDAYEMKNGKTIDDPSSGYNPDDPFRDRDPRLDASIIHPGSFYEGGYFDPLNPSSIDYYAAYSYTGYAPKKYVSHLSDIPDMWNTGLNIPVIRFAEVLLSYAEAKIELNQLDNSVYEAINKVRKRAGMPDVDAGVYNNQAKMRELVRRERRVELALEGLRWFDIQRWKIGKEALSGPVYGTRLGSVDAATGKLTLTAERALSEIRTFDESKNYLWPIPQQEIDLNKNLQQNTGY
jgi:hypothetical protein